MMTTQLLATKLYIPAVRPELVPRDRLLERLNEGLHRKLTLVSAPAGFGKTSLLSAWADARQKLACPRPLAWLSLDAGDNDPVRFLTYLTESLKGLPEFPSTPELPETGSTVDDYLTALINRTAAMPFSAVLVLDDMHSVEAPAIFDALVFFLEHLPPSLHLVISTRADPPLPIARYRALSQLTELRQADLRFTREETRAFLNRVMDLSLTPDDVKVLAERTEGWIAGLQMAAVSMQQRDDVSGFVHAFAGSHRYIMDYLLEEVLQRQSADVQKFLLYTSILEPLSALLCDAVLLDASRSDVSEAVVPREGTQSILEYLEQSNLFVVPLDDDRLWYRYHRLFADLLQRQLTQRYPELIPDLHRRASLWYETHGLYSEGIEHALAAGDYERAAALIDPISEPLLMRSEVVTLRRWLDAVPEATMERWPGLCACHAWLLLLAGVPLQTVEARLGVMARGDWASGKVQAVYTLVALFQGKIECATESIERARASLTDEDGFWYSVTQWFWGLLHLSDQDVHREDAQPLMRLIQPHMESQNVLLVVMGLCNLGELRLKQGRLRDAETLFNQALSRAVDAHDQPLPIAGEPMIWLGDLARERNELARAEQYLTEGIALISDWGRIAAFDGYLALARLRLAQGEIAAAYKVMDRANQLAVTFDATEMDDYMVAMARARMAALEGDFDTVARWVDSRGLDALDPGNLQLDETVPLHLRKYELIVLGLARILEARPDEALVLLEPLFDFVTAKGRWGLGIESLALQAIAYHMTGDVEQALACLDRALTRAEPEGYVRLFLDLGEPMAHLLYEAVRRGLYPDYAGRLLAAFPDTGAPASEPRVENNLVEPLSERELEVLGGIAEGLTNQEIAQRLYISERTVKWHAGNIYSKLQVSNRTEATARARKLGILPR